MEVINFFCFVFGLPYCEQRFITTNKSIYLQTTMYYRGEIWSASDSGEEINKKRMKIRRREAWSKYRGLKKRI